jgi:hypothetical protein
MKLESSPSSVPRAALSPAAQVMLAAAADKARRQIEREGEEE